MTEHRCIVTVVLEWGPADGERPLFRISENVRVRVRPLVGGSRVMCLDCNRAASERDDGTWELEAQ